MYKFLNSLKKRKGFTLVECLVAIAVFAALVMVVFAILANARVEATRANDTEEDLTELIDNVIGDNTFKAYYTGSDMLSLKVQGVTDTYDVSYTVIDGYNNFLLCGNCQHFANNTEFMNGVSRVDFDQSHKFKCPECATEFNATLECIQCKNSGTANSGDHTNTANFIYNPETGGFSCNKCGSTSVRQTTVTDAVAVYGKLPINSIVPNGIRYGSKIARPANKSDLVIFSDSNAPSYTGSVTLDLDYDGTYYTLTVTSSPDAAIDETNYDLVLKFPPHYRFAELTEVYMAGTGHCIPSSGDAKDFYSYLTFNLTTTGASQVKFKLLNYESGTSFEYDYSQVEKSDTDPTLEVGGLAKYWFGGTYSPAPIVDGSNIITESKTNNFTITKS